MTRKVSAFQCMYSYNINMFTCIYANIVPDMVSGFPSLPPQFENKRKLNSLGHSKVGQDASCIGSYIFMYI